MTGHTLKSVFMSLELHQGNRVPFLVFSFVSFQHIIAFCRHLSTKVSDMEKADIPSTDSEDRPEAPRPKTEAEDRGPKTEAKHRG